jgi:hypothetical protein
MQDCCDAWDGFAFGIWLICRKERLNTSPVRLFRSLPEGCVYGRRINDLRRQRRRSHSSHKLNMLPKSESQLRQNWFQLRLLRRKSPAA